MYRSLILALLLLAAPAAGAQEGPNAREKVYLLADSLDWVLAFHTLPGSRTVSCEVATKAQPGAIFKNFWDNDRLRTFTVYLLESRVLADSFVLQVNGRPPVVRKASTEEREKNVLHLRGSDSDVLAGSSRLQLQVFYPGEKQNLVIDMRGFSALYLRAQTFDCVPPQVQYEECQYWLERTARNNSSRIPARCKHEELSPR